MKKRITMKSDYLSDAPDSFKQPLVKAIATFYLQTHTTRQHDKMMERKDVKITRFINSIKLKVPDQIDIFNKVWNVS